MKNDFRFSKHAIERIKYRGLDKETVRLTLDDPDSVVTDSECKRVDQKLVKKEYSMYLYRVFVPEKSG
jgi:hypothetical protein